MCTIQLRSSTTEKGKEIYIPDILSGRPFSEPPLLDQSPIKSGEIAAKVFGVVIDYPDDATPKQRTMIRSNANRIVNRERIAGRFPRPSYTLPGMRGASVWLQATVEKWQDEYLARVPRHPIAGTRDEINAYRLQCNAAAEQATKIAEALDRKLMQRRDVEDETARA